MDFQLTEIKEKDEFLDTYGIYKYCMYMPNAEKFNKKADSLLSDDSVKIFASTYSGKTVGVTAVSFVEEHRALILGIAVDEDFRNNGCASYMIKELVREYSISSLLAETDADAVGFYKKCGFDVEAFEEEYGDERVVRYRCELAI